MDASFTLVADVPADAAAELEAALADATGSEIEQEPPALGLIVGAIGAVAYVVTHAHQLKDVFEAAKAATGLVSALIGLSERRQIKLTLVEGGRQITVEAARREDLEAILTKLLERSTASAQAG